MSIKWYEITKTALPPRDMGEVDCSGGRPGIGIAYDYDTDKPLFFVWWALARDGVGTETTHWAELIEGPSSMTPTPEIDRDALRKQLNIVGAGIRKSDVHAVIDALDAAEAERDALRAEAANTRRKALLDAAQEAFDQQADWGNADEERGWNAACEFIADRIRALIDKPEAAAAKENV